MIPPRPLNVDPARRKYHAMIGTGGVGGGLFFAIEGNTTLGREESRGGRILPQRDFCKLHIISHYVKVLLGADFPVILASQVGGDVVGGQMLDEMKRAGLDTRYMQVSPDEPTLFSVCFIYPDGSGGNLTATNSAASGVDASSMERLTPEFARWQGQGIALAAPEVPLAARIRMLEMGGDYGFLRAASLTSEEARSAEALDLVACADLLALNLDEAAALAGPLSAGRAPFEICQAVLDKTAPLHPGLMLSITASTQGSWSWDGAGWGHTPAFIAPVASTAGAGDAHISAILAGLAAGLPLPQAQQLGALAAAVKVTSPDTIHMGLDCDALLAFAVQNQLDLDPLVTGCIAIEPKNEN